MDFPMVAANKGSTARRKPIYGHGINDADYLIEVRVNNKRVTCPYYRVWVNILVRVFDQKLHAVRPTYRECSITDEWLLFSNFRKWMEKQDWHEKELDKDLLIPGNREYKPDACIFIPSEINSLLLDSNASRGAYSQGVSYIKRMKKFRAGTSMGGENKFLGHFNTVEEAESVYKIAKAVVFARAAAKQSDPRIIHALMVRAHKLNVAGESV